jgi:thiol-disulfide isomerase/thioredoxin
MKLVIWIFLFNLLCPKLFSQTRINLKDNCKPFSLTVKVNNQDTGRVLLMFGSCGDSNPVTVVNLKNGMAKFNGFINQASSAVIITDASSERYRVDGPKAIEIILEPKPMNLSYSLNDSSVYDIVISGSNSQTELDIWLKQNSSNLNLVDNIGEKFNPNLTVAERKLISNELDSVYSKIVVKIKNFVIQNKDSYASTYLLRQYYRKIPIDSLKIYYSLLSDKAKNNSIGEILLENILTLSSKDDAFTAKYGSKNFHAQLKSAKSFLDFTLSDADDKTYKLNNFKDQYTFVDLWATWCTPCVKNIPAYEKLKTQYKYQPINFVSISVDKDANKWKKALQQYKLTGTNLLDIDNILPSFYEIQGFPRYLIIGPDGKVVESNAPWPGSTQLNKLIVKYTLKKTGN